MYYLRVLLVGIYFGVILVKSEVVRWERIHQMFLFHLYERFDCGPHCIVAIMLVPQGMAYAVLAGLPANHARADLVTK